MELDLNLRVRIYELEKHLKQQVSAHYVWSTCEVALTWYVSPGTCPGMGECTFSAEAQVQGSIQCSIRLIAMLCNRGQVLHFKCVAHG